MVGYEESAQVSKQRDARGVGAKESYGRMESDRTERAEEQKEEVLEKEWVGA